jgi:hypothetical protein
LEQAGGCVFLDLFLIVSQATLTGGILSHGDSLRSLLSPVQNSWIECFEQEVAKAAEGVLAKWIREINSFNVFYAQNKGRVLRHGAWKLVAIQQKTSRASGSFAT